MSDDDDSTVVTVTGDPSEGEDVVAVGTGDTVEESEQDARDNPDFDFGGDDDGGGGGGGSSSSGSSGGSGSQNNSGSSDDDSTVVTVTGEPGSEKGQTVVGQGDTVRESEIDAATNQRFDADEGTSVDRIEERLGTDQARRNPDDQESESTNVVVTGDPSRNETVRTVGQAQTRQGAQVQAAANQRFDAAQGTQVDAIESRLETGQGDGTDFQKTQNQVQPSQQPTKQPEQDQTREELQPFETAQRMQTARQGRNQRIEQAAQESGLAGTLTIRGVQIMQEGQRLSEDAAEAVGTGENVIETGFDIIEDVAPENENVQDTLDLAEQGALGFQRSSTQSTGVGQGLALSSQVTETARSGEVNPDDASDIIETVSGNTVSDTQRDIRESTSQGVGTLGTQLGGLAVATPGAVARATRDDTPSIGEGINTGLELTGEEVSEDPGEFIAEETGEEIGEAVVGTALLGPAGAAVGATPVPEITPSVEARAAETERFLRGDLGSRVENERVIQKPFPAEGNAESAFFERQTEQLEDGGRAQQAIEVDPAEETVTVGQREETPVTRTDVLRDNLDAGRQEVDSFLDGNAIGSGPGAFLPEEETSPDVEPENNPESLPDQDLFEEPASGGDTFVESVSTPSRTRPAGLDTGIDQEFGLDQGQEQEPGLEERQPPQEEPPVQEFRQEPEQETDPGLETGIEFGQEPEQEPEQFIETRPELEPEVQTTPGLGEETQQSFFDIGFDEPAGTGNEPEANPDLTSLVFGGGEENVGGTENPATGLERRAPAEEEDELENDGFLNQF